MRIHLVFLAMLASGCATAPVGPAIKPPTRGRPVYEGRVSIRPEEGSLSARWTVRLAPGTDSVTFLLNPALTIERVGGTGVLGHRDTVSDGRRHITVRLSPGASAVDFAYSGRPRFSTDSINGIGREWVELALDSFWLPVIADFAQSITGTVDVTLPDGWHVASGGSVVRSGVTHTLRQTVPLIDVPLSAAPRMRVSSFPRGRVFNVRATDEMVARVSATAQQCGDYLDARYGSPLTLAQLSFVLAPRGGPGYARKNYIVITSGEDLPPLALTRFVCHEVAHYWSTGAIASGPDNWLNEAFAEFVSARAVREILGSAAYDSVTAHWGRNAGNAPPIWVGERGPRPGSKVSYSKAPLLLDRLEVRVGASMMDAILLRFLTGSVRTTPGVMALVEEVAGAETGAWFRAELAK